MVDNIWKDEGRLNKAISDAIDKNGVDSFIDEWYHMHMGLEKEMETNEELREMNIFEYLHFED